MKKLIFTAIPALALLGCGNTYYDAGVTGKMLSSCLASCLVNGGLAFVRAKDEYSACFRCMPVLSAYHADCKCNNGGTFHVTESAEQGRQAEQK